MKTISKEARAARAAYARSWRKRNPDKVKAAHARYWEKKAMLAQRPTATE